ncbi:uncharacterized protein LTR77_001560 [Saxophila tyrrhenica]|uniref:ABC transporter domain-containing protein n=1 Tax=Saxophila tyrrhenica TaxID=1690608 RepID=A0AAV9PL56_9PEZI|nr:hypothetical protein LTR77_001560 [Saxophila tyrrhenica]
MDTGIHPYPSMDPPFDHFELVARQNGNQGQMQDATNALAEFGGFQNFSSRKYDAYVFTLDWKTTGCYQRGVLPVPLAKNDTCLPGWHCPNSDFYNPPQFCAPTPECAVFRAGKMTCEPQGVYEPKICANGFYCPGAPNGHLQLPCPEGTFCPTGAKEPFNCTGGAICPEKSQRQLVIAPLFVMIIIDVVLLVIVGIGFGVTKWRRSRPKKYTTLDAGDGNSDNIELLLAARAPPRSSRVSVSAPAPPPHSPYAQYSPPQSDYMQPYAPPYSQPQTPQPYPESYPPSYNQPYNPSVSPRPPTLTHARRASGRVDNMDGYVDDDLSDYGDYEPEDDFHNSPDFQRFIRSMSKTIETSSIGLSFDFENLTYATKNGKGKKILSGVTGTMPRGSCWGIMGGSGAGKSTFVNVLMGKLQATAGTMKINGWQKDMSKYKKLIGYVPQDDIIFPELTVRENILHSARVRLPASWRDKAIQDHVDSLIACLQLTHVQHSRVGDARKPVISGGQRKRVNIGIELAAAPMAIFLDEPTSGLDATSAATIMRLIKGISKLGVTTIAIIHQPREQIFAGFDQLLLLAEGQSVYSGPTEDVSSYFENLGFAFPQRANPADTLIDIITGDGAQYTMSGKRDTDVRTLINTWQTSGQYNRSGKHLSVSSFNDAATKRSRRASNQSLNSTAEQEESLVRTMKARGATWPAQVFYCWKRAMTQQVRNATSFFFEIGVGALAGVIIGLSAFASAGHLFQGIYHPPFTSLSSAVDYSSTPQLGLLGGLAIGLAASAPGFWVFGEEKQMYYRETASGHSRSAYYVGKLIATLLRIALSAFHFTVFLGVLATPLIAFQWMYVVNLLYFWCVYGLASIVSMIVKREDGPLIAVLGSLVIGVLGGVAPPLSTVKSWGLEWLWRASPGVWLTEAYFTENLTPLGYLYELDLAASATGFTLGQYGLDVGILFLIGFVYRIVAYLLLVFLHRDKQR